MARDQTCKLFLNASRGQIEGRTVQKVWSVLFGVVLFAMLVLFFVSPVLRWWLPQDISTFGNEVDFLYYMILFLTGFFFVLTEALLVYFLWRYLADPKRKAYYTHGNHKLEWFWTIVTAVLLVFIAVAQIKAWDRIKYQNSMPKPTHIFEVAAKQFEWRIRYPSRETMEQMQRDWESNRVPASAKAWERTEHADDIHVVNEVHVWAGDQPAKVRLFLKSRDVLHSFFLPNLRLKQDAVPGKTIPVWFEATEPSNRMGRRGTEWKPYGESGSKPTRKRAGP